MKRQGQNIGIKLWAEADRPREKLMRLGRRQLSDAELLAILIVSGNSLETAVDLSKRILRHFNNDLNELGKASLEVFTEFKGMGQAKALSIIAALELGRRRSIHPQRKKFKISSSKDAYQLLQEKFLDLQHEEFWMLLLNRQNQLINMQLISLGGQAGTVADPKIIFEYALRQHAAGILVAHNHPSGQLKPSEEDMRLTRKLYEGCRLLDLMFLDHIIVGHAGYFSFKDADML